MKVLWPNETIGALDIEDLQTLKSIRHLPFKYIYVFCWNCCVLNKVFFFWLFREHMDWDSWTTNLFYVLHQVLRNASGAGCNMHYSILQAPEHHNNFIALSSLNVNDLYSSSWKNNDWTTLTCWMKCCWICSVHHGFAGVAEFIQSKRTKKHWRSCKGELYIDMLTEIKILKCPQIPKQLTF